MSQSDSSFFKNPPMSSIRSHDGKNESGGCMFIQGNLQVVFDALYSVGAIDPILGMDWTKINSEMMESPQLVNKACARINACSGDLDLLVQTLKALEPKLLNFVAMEVAREFCEFQDRKALH